MHFIEFLFVQVSNFNGSSSQQFMVLVKGAISENMNRIFHECINCRIITLISSLKLFSNLLQTGFMQLLCFFSLLSFQLLSSVLSLVFEVIVILLDQSIVFFWFHPIQDSLLIPHGDDKGSLSGVIDLECSIGSLPFFDNVRVLLGFKGGIGFPKLEFIYLLVVLEIQFLQITRKILQLELSSHQQTLSQLDQHLGI